MGTRSAFTAVIEHLVTLLETKVSGKDCPGDSFIPQPIQRQIYCLLGVKDPLKRIATIAARLWCPTLWTPIYLPEEMWG